MARWQLLFRPWARVCLTRRQHDRWDARFVMFDLGTQLWFVTGWPRDHGKVSGFIVKIGLPIQFRRSAAKAWWHLLTHGKRI